MKKESIYLLITLAILTSCERSQENKSQSPDGNLTLTAGIDSGRLYYEVAKNEKKILNKSFMGFILKDGELGKGIEITKSSKTSLSQQWNPVFGEESTIKNSYNELTVTVQEKEGLKRSFEVVFRVFNDGLGFRYIFPEQEKLKDFVIMDELTEFALADSAQAWSIPYKTNFYEGLYKPSLVTQLDTVCSPLTLESKSGLFLAIHEANLTDYAAMNLTSVNKSNTLKTYLTPWSGGESVFVTTTRKTPWRTIIIAESAGDLMLSRIMLNLNEPSKIEDTSWIKPGRYIGIWWGMHLQKYTWPQGPKHGATTKLTKRYIDFAAKYGFAGVLVEGWNYGWEEWKNYKFTTPYPDFNIAEITDYAASKNVQLIGHHETGADTKNYENQLDSAYKFYNKYNVSTVKTGYVGALLDGKEHHNGQYGVRHYRKVIETAAKYKINIDNHEPVMPTGLQRTYPNLMTQEGVRGQEYDAWSVDGGNPPEHTTIIPFTRGLAGPMDFTPGTFNFSNPVLPTTYVHTTLAKQLALSVVLYSPLQMASDMIENYENNPAVEFITSCPTNWAATVVPDAKIGSYVTIARKDSESENWYVGSITNGQSRKLSVPLTFLSKDKKYSAKFFRDGNGANFQTNPYPIIIEEQEVNSSTILELDLASGGGTAIILKQLD